jgi:DNA adenine methylase
LSIPKPFLRWAGGKNWLVKYLPELMPNNFRNYHEPFLGGGSIFFSIQPATVSFLSDLNTELVETYSTIRDNVGSVIRLLETYKNTAEDYYRIREVNAQTDKVERAARFIYLNQTSFNGIYRVNLHGNYNVPYGFRKKKFLEPENLLKVSQLLKRAVLQTGDFEIVLQNVKRGDLVFLDPPYSVSHNDNGFIKYNQKLFSLDDQYRLSSIIDRIKEADAYYMLTNARHKKIEEIFEKGDSKIELSRANLIGGTKAKRGHVNEYVFTNVKF